MSLENTKGFTLNIKVKSKLLGPFIFSKSKRYIKEKRYIPSWKYLQQNLVGSDPVVSEPRWEAILNFQKKI